MLRFAANLSMLWREVPFLERFARAREAGFIAVEFHWPRGEDLQAVVEAARGSGLQVVLHNMDAGDMAAGERGYANDPARQEEWRERFVEALRLARRLECPRINCLVGNALPDVPRELQWAVVLENLRWALPQAREANVILTLEALNPIENPRYLLHRTSESLHVLRALGFPPNLKIQYDIYHMQRSEGNLVATLREIFPYLGHVQIADPPGRHQPGTGEIAWARVLGTLEALGYEGYIGLEYVPLGGTEESLGWLPPERRQEATVADLRL
ncbi:hydroxypyruvate isomerase family protein [Thermoflexus sp.]|uniref:hydroxypyruvate isomerase family protein n=1 Tax=Thermoflexus sp. TaxID=1969742 RepID=UPI0035E4378D